jgi:hypothetical protein
MSEAGLEDADSAQTLWNIGLEVLTKAVLLWRTYKDDDRSKGIKINSALRIARVVCELLDRHPDVLEVKKSRERMEQLLREVQSQ